MKRAEVIRLIRYQLNSDEHPGAEAALVLLDLLISQGGATLGDVTKIKELILEDVYVKSSSDNDCSICSRHRNKQIPL